MSRLFVRGVVVFTLLFFSNCTYVAAGVPALSCPTITGQYTLRFQMTFDKVDNHLGYVKNGDFTKPSLLTLSSDNNRILWRMENGSWHYVVIYDKSKSELYECNSAGINARIMRGKFGHVVSDIPYMPFPGTGLSDFIFLRSLSPSSQNNACNAQMLLVGGTGPNTEPLYLPVSVQFEQWNSYNVVSSCVVPSVIYGRKVSASDIPVWHFDNYVMFGGVPIASNAHYNDLDGKYAAKYHLLESSSTPLSHDEMSIEHYLKAGVNSIDDWTGDRKTSYWYNPKLGDLAAQRKAHLAREDEYRAGTNPDRPKTGIFALIALLLFGAALYFRLRKKNQTQ